MGRPSFEPTDEQRAQVSKWKQDGVAIEEMARRLELAPKTFRKHFASELGIDPVITRSRPTDQGPTPEILPPEPPKPPYRPTTDERQRVMILAGAQISEKEIARKLGITLDMLKEHFGTELADGPAVFKSDIIESLYYSARGGNTSAAKTCLGLTVLVDDPFRDDQPSPVAKAVLGKKEARLEAAKTAGQGTDWGEDLETPPARSVN